MVWHTIEDKELYLDPEYGAPLEEEEIQYLDDEKIQQREEESEFLFAHALGEIFHDVLKQYPLSRSPYSVHVCAPNEDQKSWIVVYEQESTQKYEQSTLVKLLLDEEDEPEEDLFSVAQFRLTPNHANKVTSTLVMNVIEEFSKRTGHSRIRVDLAGLDTGGNLSYEDILRGGYSPIPGNLFEVEKMLELPSKT